MTLLEASVSIPTTSWEWFKAIAPLLTGGVVGALITAFLTDRRNRIQPVGKRLTVSSIDIPAIMPGYDSEITLSNSTSGHKYHYTGLATLQLELTNTGNKDITSFDLGVNLPAGATIIGIQHEGPDRYHIVTQKSVISIEHPADYADFVLAPFNRKDTYYITLVVSYNGDELLRKVKLSTTQPVRLVNEFTIDKAELAYLRGFLEIPFPLGTLLSLALPKSLRAKINAGIAESKRS